jgi:hypothetical protein
MVFEARAADIWRGFLTLAAVAMRAIAGAIVSISSDTSAMSSQAAVEHLFCATVTEAWANGREALIEYMAFADRPAD